MEHGDRGQAFDFRVRFSRVMGGDGCQAFDFRIGRSQIFDFRAKVHDFLSNRPANDDLK
jgi:hypothetical protein